MSFTFLNRNLVRAAAVICTGLSGIAWAQAPASSLSLIFLEPTGVVAPTGSIPVNLRFTNNDPGLDFVVDSALPNGGLDASILPIEGQGYDTDTGTYFFAPYASYTSFDLTIGFGCSGNFTAPGKCLDGPPYTFEFASNPFSNRSRWRQAPMWTICSAASCRPAARWRPALMSFTARWSG